MPARLTQALLGLIALLLAAHLAISHGIPRTAAAQGAVVPDVLRARLIELVNDRGAVVGQLYTGEDGSGQLRFRSAGGEVRVKLGATDDGSGLVLMDGRTEPAVWLASGPDGSRITLAQQGRAPRVLTP